MSTHTIVENAKSNTKVVWERVKKPVLIVVGSATLIGVGAAVVKARRSKTATLAPFEDDSVTLTPFEGGFTVTAND